MTERYRLRGLGNRLTAAAVCLALLSGCGQAELGKNTEIASSHMDSALEQTGVSQAASPLEDETDSSDAPEQAAAATPVDALPEKLRVAAHLHYCEGYSVKETAQLLGCPEGTVKSRLSRARELLRLELSEEEA